MTQAYPLQWPAGKPRCKYPRHSQFASRTIERAQSFMHHEIHLLGGGSTVLSTNLRLRNDGLPYSNQSRPRDQGVAVYFKYNNEQMCFACDQWEKIEENIYAIGKTIEALRGVERWGSGDMMKQAFTGFVALPAQKSCWDILGISPGASDDVIETAYRARAMTAHPDKGGSHTAMWELNDARERAKRNFG